MTTHPSGCPHPIQCILPPHMLEAIIQNGSPAQREAARAELAVSEHYRAQRSLVTAVPSLEAVARPHKSRAIYDAKHLTNLPGVIARKEGDPPTGDLSVNEAYDGLGATFDLYWKIFNRNSIDDAGQDLLGTVHFGNKYNNAFWNGTNMVFGDGDGVIFNRFTIAIDVMGHELTHGVVQHTANLVYSNQPGALNESMADCFGSMVKQFRANETSAQADWLIGAGLLAPGIHGVALRSMKAPGTAYDDATLGKDPQPDHMSKYVNTTSDNGGVHINSGIPNRAFYFTAVALGGHSWDRAGKIWYRTLTDSRLSSNAQFQDFANLTVDNASRLYGSNVASQTVNAWRRVGINVVQPKAWEQNKLILRTYTTPHSMNAWAFIEGAGWRKIEAIDPDGVTNLFSLLVDAQAYKSRVNVLVDGSTLYRAFSI